MTHRALTCILGAALALAARPGHAQAPAAKPAAVDDAEALTDTARKLFQEGVKEAKAGRWANAYASFLAAWNLKKAPSIATNLGTAALRMGRHREAAEHLTWYLRETPETKVDERKAAEASLKEALTKIAAVTVRVAPEGAEIAVDGKPVGRAPLRDPVFLDPGEHAIGATLEGHIAARQAVTAKARSAETVELRLEKTPAPVVVSVGGAVAPDGPTMRNRSGEETRRVVLVAGGAATAVGVVSGVVFTVMANIKASDAKALWKEVDAMKPYQDCRAITDPSHPCEKLSDADDGRAYFSNVAFWSFLGAGAVGIGTAAYWYLTRAPAEPGKRVQAAPLVGPGLVGISMSGTF